MRVRDERVTTWRKCASCARLTRGALCGWTKKSRICMESRTVLVNRARSYVQSITSTTHEHDSRRLRRGPPFFATVVTHRDDHAFAVTVDAHTVDQLRRHGFAAGAALGRKGLVLFGFLTRHGVAAGPKLSA